MSNPTSLPTVTDFARNAAPARRRRSRPALVAAAAAAAGFAPAVASAADALVTGRASTSATVNEAGIKTGFVDVIGSTSGVTNSQFAFGVLDFNSSTFTAPIGSTSNSALANGNLSLSLGNSSYYGSSANPFQVNFFLETDTATALVTGTNLKFDDATTPGGVGANTGFAAGSSLIPLGSGTYINPPPNAATGFTYNLSIPSASLSYVNGQFAAGANLRLIAVANDSSGTVVSGQYTDYVGAAYAGASNTSSTAPMLTVDLLTTPITAYTFNPGATNNFNFNTADKNFQTSSGTAAAFVNGTTANFTQAGVGTVTVAAGGVAPSSMNVSNATGTYTFTGGPINDYAANAPTGIVKNNAGTLVLAAANNFSGGIVVNGGILQAAADGYLGAAAGSLSLGNGGTFQATGDVTGARTVNLLAPVNGSTGVATIDNGGHNLTFASLFGGKQASVVVTGSGTTTLSGAGGVNLFTSGGVSATLSVLGGTLTINQPVVTGASGVVPASLNSYFNGTAAGGGFTGNLVLASPTKVNLNANGTISGGGTITVTSSGALFAVTGGTAAAPLTATIANNIVLNPNNAGGLADGQNLPFTFNLGATGANTVGTGTNRSTGYSNTLVVSGVISGNADLNFGSTSSTTTTADDVGAGSGVVVLNARNSYTGATRISFGQYANAGNANAGQGATVQSYGVVRLGVDNALPVTTSVTFGSTNTANTNATGPNVGLLDLYGHSQSITALRSNFTGQDLLGTTGAVGGIANFSNLPGGNGLAATLAITGSASTVFNGPIGSVVNNFDGAGNVSAGSGNINLTLAASHTGTLELTAPNNYTGTTSVLGGTLVASTPAVSAAGIAQSAVGTGPLLNNGSFRIAVDGTGTIAATTAAARPSSVTGTGTTLVDTASVLTANLVRQSALTVNGSVAINVQSPRPSAAATVSNVGTLTLAGSTNAWTGSVNLGNADLIVAAGDLATVTNQVAVAFAGGAWNGPTGIASAAAAADTRHLTALGVISNSVANYASFDGQPVTAAAVLVKYTYYGDVNLDGAVTAADYTRVDAGFLGHLTGWANGDLNYDGTVDGSDYALMDNAFNQQTASFAALIASSPEPAGTPALALAALIDPVAVPEPTAIGLLGVVGVGFAGRRRRSARA